MTDDLTKTPLGVPSFDRHINGGIQQGTSVLVIGPFGSGYREFLRTGAIIHGNWQAETELFEREYDEQTVTLHRPSKVRFFSITESESRIRRSLSTIGGSDWVEPALEHIGCSNFPDKFANLGPIYPSPSGGIEYRDLRERNINDYRQILQQFGDELFGGSDDEFILWDAITDFLPIAYKYMDWSDFFCIAQTITHLISASNNILVASADADLLNKREEGLLKRTFDVVLDFAWYGEGMQKYQIITVTKFHQLWSELDMEKPMMFDITIDRGQYGVSNVQEIPTSRL